MLKVFRWHYIFLWFVYVWVTVILCVIRKCVAIVHNSESKKTQKQPGLKKPEHSVNIFTDERRMLMAYQRGWRIMPDKDMGNFKQHTCFEMTQWWHELSFLGELSHKIDLGWFAANVCVGDKWVVWKVTERHMVFCGVMHIGPCKHFWISLSSIATTHTFSLNLGPYSPTHSRFLLAIYQFNTLHNINLDSMI